MLITVLLGLVVGLVLGLTGAGGSIIAVPLLMFGLHLSPLEAAPIALLAVTLSAATGAAFGLKEGKLRYRAASFIALLGILTAPIGAWLALRLPLPLLTLTFAGVLAYVAIRMLKQSFSTQTKLDVWADETHAETLPCQLKQNKARIDWTMRCARALGVTGMITGLTSGLLGVGGGFIVVPALKQHSHLEATHIMPTSLGVITLISGSAVITMLWQGRLRLDTASLFALGAVLGMLLSRPFVKRANPAQLQRYFGLFALGVSLFLIIKTIGGLHAV